MNEMTAQEVFTKVVEHLRKQGCKSREDVSQDPSYNGECQYLCLYRGPNNTMCAAGCLIEDDEYQSWMERNGIQNLLENVDCLASLIERIKPHLHLVAVLQDTHDCFAVEDWERQFQYIAKNKGLQL